MAIRHVSVNWLTDNTLYILLESVVDALMKLSTCFYVYECFCSMPLKFRRGLYFLCNWSCRVLRSAMWKHGIEPSSSASQQILFLPCWLSSPEASFTQGSIFHCGLAWAPLLKVS